MTWGGHERMYYQHFKLLTLLDGFFRSTDALAGNTALQTAWHSLSTLRSSST